MKFARSWSRSSIELFKEASRSAGIGDLSVYPKLLELFGHIRPPEVNAPSDLDVGEIALTHPRLDAPMCSVESTCDFPLGEKIILREMLGKVSLRCGRVFVRDGSKHGEEVTKIFDSPPRFTFPNPRDYYGLDNVMGLSMVVPRRMIVACESYAPC